MKNKAWIFAVLALAVVLVAAVLLYPKLKAEYTPPVTQAQTARTDATSTESVQEVKTVPDFTVTDNDGKLVSLSDYFGTPIVLNFWATWCGPCRAELPAFDKAYAEYGDEVALLMVNLTDGIRDTEAGVAQFVAENGYSFPVYLDKEGSAANAYELYSIPMTVFINADGSLMDYRIGELSEEVLEDCISQLIGK